MWPDWANASSNPRLGDSLIFIKSPKHTSPSPAIVNAAEMNHCAHEYAAALGCKWIMPVQIQTPMNA